MRVTHGMYKLPEYRIFKSMWQRCANPKSQGYANYGGRGITVCERWKSFEAFIADMGPRPSPDYDIDRERNEEGYSPGNCRWLPSDLNKKNTRRTRWVEYQGRRMCLQDAADLAGVPYPTANYRLRVGKPIEQVLQKGRL